MVPVRRATFVSILVPRATIAEHGLPIASMFIWGEDTEYTLRVTQEVPGFVVGASKVLHLRQEHGAINIVTENNPARLKYHRHHMRNELFVARKYYRQRRLILSLVYQLSLMLKLLGRGELHKVRIVLQGLLESLWYYPSTEAADAPTETLGVSIRSPSAEPATDIPATSVQ
jgi:dTDP-4-dehydrorhamnose reductase